MIPGCFLRQQEGGIYRFKKWFNSILFHMVPSWPNFINRTEYELSYHQKGPFHRPRICGPIRPLPRQLVFILGGESSLLSRYVLFRVIFDHYINLKTEGTPIFTSGIWKMKQRRTEQNTLRPERGRADSAGDRIVRRTGVDARVNFFLTVRTFSVGEKFFYPTTIPFNSIRAKFSTPIPHPRFY